MVAWQFSIFPGNNKAKNKGLRCRGSRFRGVIWSFQKRFLTPRHEVSNGWVWYQNFSGRWDCYFKTCRTAIRGDLFFWGFWWLSLSELWYGFESHDDDFRVVRIAFGLKWFSKLFHVVTIFLINQTLMVWSYAWYFCWFHLHSLTQIFRVLQLFFSYRPHTNLPSNKDSSKSHFVACQVWRCKRPNKQLLKRPRRKKSKSLPSESLRDAGEMELGYISKLPWPIILRGEVFLSSVGKLFYKKRQGSFLSTELKLVWNYHSPFFQIKKYDLQIHGPMLKPVISPEFPKKRSQQSTHITLKVENSALTTSNPHRLKTRTTTPPENWRLDTRNDGLEWWLAMFGIYVQILSGVQIQKRRKFARQLVV